MINRPLLLKALSQVPDPTSVIRFVDNMSKVDVQVEVVDQATLPEQIHASYRIKADSMRQNTWLRWTLMGDAIDGPPNAANITLRVRWGGLTGQVLVTAVKQIPTSVSSYAPWKAVVDIQCGGPIGPTCGILSWLSIFWAPTPDATISYSTHAIDTTVDNVLAFTAQIDDLGGGPHFRTFASSLESF